MKKNNIISDWLDKYGDPKIDKFIEIQLNQNNMTGFYDLMDSGMADALGVDTETYITVIEDHCTIEEADIIFNGIWFEQDETVARKLFASKLKELK